MSSSENQRFARLIQCFERGDADQVKKLLGGHPQLLQRDNLLGRAVRHGDLAMVKLVRRLGGGDLQKALGYTIYGAKREIAEFLIAEGAVMSLAGGEDSIIVGACELLDPASARMALALAAEPLSASVAKQCAAMLVSTYCRNPAGKRDCLELIRQTGFSYPDTAPMALHRGRLDLLERHLAADPKLFSRRFRERDVYPAELGVQPGDGLHLAPLDGVGLLHMAVEYDEREILAWAVARGADVNLPAAVDGQGFGGHTPLFHTTVSYTFQDGDKARLLLDSGAEPNHRVDLRKQLKHMGRADLEEPRVFRQVTAIGFARAFQCPWWVSEASIEEIEARGGVA